MPQDSRTHPSPRYRHLLAQDREMHPAMLRELRFPIIERKPGGADGMAEKLLTKLDRPPSARVQAGA